MSLVHAFFLGLVQGIAEFLPISSSGHLLLLERFLGIEEPSVRFHLICHLGTLGALLFYFWRDLFAKWHWLFLGTLPLVFGVFVHPHLEGWLLGAAFMITALVLWSGERFARSGQAKPKHALAIGFMQLMALFPGISRSGATISGARWFGWSRAEAIRFSFMLAIPAIAGGAILEVGASGDEGWLCDLIALVTAFGVSLLALKFFIKLLTRHGLKPFAWYCAAIGVLCCL